MTRFLTAAICIFAALLPTQAQTIDEARASAQADLRAALDELATLNKTIGDEKLPLSRRLNEVEDQVITLRREFDRAQRDQENQLVDLNTLRSEVRRQKEEAAFVSGLLGEYVRLFETRTHISEIPLYRREIEEAKLAAGNADLSPRERLEKEAAVTRVALGRIEKLLGGDRFEGQALAPNGRFERGRFALIGPVTLFSSAESDVAGPAELQLGSPEPTMISLEPEATSAIRALAQSGSGELPLDPTMGNALKIAAQNDTLVAHIKKGGPVMVPILVLGLAALVVCVVKWAQISQIRLATPRDLQIILDHIEEGQKEKAAAHARTIAGPVGEMILAGIEHVGERKEYIEEVMYEKMLAAKPRLERLLPILALSAATAPLLGLLGTVTGMINTFNMITVFGTGDPSTLAGGISEALITTEYGLVVAIPSLLFHAFISRKAKGVLSGMERTSVAFINGVPTKEEEGSVYA